jgi:hypothetical protein
MRQGREGEICLIKNVSGDDDIVGGEIKTPVTFVVSEVSEENTSGGAGCHFVSGFGREIRIAGTIEHVQVKQICDGVEPFYPVASQNRSLKN